MNDDAHIPVLNDLIYRGRLQQQTEEKSTPLDTQGDLEIESEDDSSVENNLALKAAEIRFILSKHMDNAYVEIMQLLEQKKEQ